MRTKFAMIILFLAFFATSISAAEEYQWEAVIRINTPDRLWKVIESIEELQPVIRSCSGKTTELLMGQYFRLPKNFMADEAMCVGIGRSKNRNDSIHAVWSEKSDGTRTFVGVFEFFLVPFMSSENHIPDAVDEMDFPAAFAGLDQSAILHLRFISERAVSDLTDALAAELTREDQKHDYRCRENLRKLQRRLRKGEISGLPTSSLPECPLHGRYSFDADSIKFVCSHRLAIPDIDKASFDGFQKAAYDFLKMLQGLKSFDVKLGNAAEKLVLEVDTASNMPGISEGMLAAYSIPAWFEGAADLKNFSHSASLHLLFAPDYAKLLDNMRVGGPGFAEADFGGRKLEEFFPKGPLQISVFGGSEPGRIQAACHSFFGRGFTGTICQSQGNSGL